MHNCFHYDLVNYSDVILRDIWEQSSQCNGFAVGKLPFLLFKSYLILGVSNTLLILVLNACKNYDWENFILCIIVKSLKLLCLALASLNHYF